MEEEMSRREIQYIVATTVQKIISMEILALCLFYRPIPEKPLVPDYNEVLVMLNDLGATDFLKEGDYKTIGSDQRCGLQSKRHAIELFIFFVSSIFSIDDGCGFFFFTMYCGLRPRTVGRFFFGFFGSRTMNLPNRERSSQQQIARVT